MATTTIPWDDGSGDNIYLTYSSASGDQTVEVSSDANSGYTDRVQTITFTASANGSSSVKVLTITQEGVPEPYIVFVDPNVESVCATKWGDGVGITASQAAEVTDSQFGTTFSGNASITSFTELVYFTKLRTISSTAFQNCTALTELVIPSNVTSITNGNVFGGCRALTSLKILSTATINLRMFNNCGNGGSLIINGSVTRNTRNYENIYFNHIIIKGNYTHTNDYGLSRRPEIKSIRIGGNYSSNGWLIYTYSNGNSQFAFLEILGNASGPMVSSQAANACANGMIIHLGYEHKVTSTANQVTSSNTNTRNRISKIYVGDGSSSEHDNAVLAEYLADSGWSAISSKLDTWYNYVNSPNANQDYVKPISSF